MAASCACWSRRRLTRRCSASNISRPTRRSARAIRRIPRTTGLRAELPKGRLRQAGPSRASDGPRADRGSAARGASAPASCPRFPSARSSLDLSCYSASSPGLTRRSSNHRRTLVLDASGYWIPACAGMTSPVEIGSVFERLPDLLGGGGELGLIGHSASMGLERLARFARDDVDMEVEHGLAGRRAVELLDQHAFGAHGLLDLR